MLSNAIPGGKFKEASVAFPPSPLKPASPLPAIVVIIPLVSTFLILLLCASAIYILSLSIAILSG